MTRPRGPRPDDARSGDPRRDPRAAKPVTPGVTRVPSCLEATPDGAATRLTLRAQPGARRSGYAGMWNDMPKFAVTAPPEDGRANLEIADVLARLFGVRTSAIAHVGGATSRTKVYQLPLPLARVAARLRELETEHASDRDRPEGKQ